MGLAMRIPFPSEKLTLEIKKERKSLTHHDWASKLDVYIQSEDFLGTNATGLQPFGVFCFCDLHSILLVLLFHSK
jgi:hypothetical protein